MSLLTQFYPCDAAGGGSITTSLDGILYDPTLQEGALVAYGGGSTGDPNWTNLGQDPSFITPNTGAAQLASFFPTTITSAVVGNGTPLATSADPSVNFPATCTYIRGLTFNNFSTFGVVNPNMPGVRELHNITAITSGRNGGVVFQNCSNLELVTGFKTYTTSTIMVWGAKSPGMTLAAVEGIVKGIVNNPINVFFTGNQFGGDPYTFDYADFDAEAQAVLSRLKASGTNITGILNVV